MGVERGEDGRRYPPPSEKRKQITSVVNSIELVEYAAALLEARNGEEADEITHSASNVGVEGVTEVALVEQRATSASAPSIWAMLLLPPLKTQLRCLDLSFNELDDAFWALWASKGDDRASRHSVEWSALSVLALNNNR